MNSEIQLSNLRIDGDTQPRAKIDTETVADYAVVTADDLPAVDVFFDGVDYWLAEGFHRYPAAAKRGDKTISCRIRKGTARDARIWSWAANWSHGLRRTSADKRKCVAAALADAEIVKQSDRAIAEMCGVTNHLVAEVRAQVGENPTCDTRQDSPRVGKDGKKYRTASRKRTSGKKHDPALGIDMAAAEAEDLAAVEDLANKTPDQKCAEHNAAIEGFCRKLYAYFDAEVPSLPWVTDGLVRSAKGNLKACCDTFGGVKCAACPACEGAGCADCRDVGYLPKGSAAQLGRVR